MRNATVKYLMYPLHEFLKGNSTLKVLKTLEINQWYPTEQLRELQLNRLKALIKHAYSTVPFYKKRFDEYGIRYDDIKGFNDFAKLPFLTKDDIRNNLECLISTQCNKNNLIKYSTGGSTGSPAIFYVERDRVSYEWAATWRARRWWGVDIGDKEVTLWGSPIELSTQDWVKKFRDRLLNRRLLSSFNMSDRSMHEYVKLLYKFRPRYIFGYSSSVYIFSEFIKKHYTSVRDVGIKVIFTTSDMLYDFQRKNIKYVFGCPVSIEYGARDGGFIAHECPKGGLHLSADGLYVEFIKDGKPVAPGDQGEIVITNLDTYNVPFIRYKIGDVGSPSDKQCACGRGLPLMHSMQGRATDFLITKDGRLIHELAITYILRELEGVVQFRVIQETVSKINVEIVKNVTFNLDNLEIIKRKIRKLFNAELDIEINIVDHIDTTYSGKYRYVISKVTNEYFNRT